MDVERGVKDKGSKVERERERERERDSKKGQSESRNCTATDYGKESRP